MFAPDAPVLRVTDVAATTGLPKSSVSRMMKELAGAGFVERDRNSRAFRPGSELFRLGALFSHRAPLEDRIDEACRRLIAAYPATAYVGVLSGMDLVVLRLHEGRHPVRYIQEPGSSIPAYATAVGKAVLAHLPDAELDALLPARMSTPFREAAYTRTELRAELEEIRRRGHAVMVDRRIRIGAIGVAVSIGSGRVMGFAICYALDAIAEDDLTALAAELTDAAREIGRAAGDPRWR